MTSKINIIELEKVKIGFGNKVLADDINLTLQSGSITAVVGRNGSGKSTLLKTIPGLLPPLSGSIFIDGKNIKAYDGVELALKVAMVLTEPVITRDLNVTELVSYGRYPHTSWLGKIRNEDMEIIMQSIEETGLKTLSNRTISSLSDGEMQRVMIAKALAQQTPVMILDEPTSHLDIYNRKEIVSLLRDLAKKKNMTILFSSHEPDLVEKYADKVWLFGKSGSVKEVPPGVFED